MFLDLSEKPDEDVSDDDELDEDALLLALEELDNAPLIKKPASY